MATAPSTPGFKILGTEPAAIIGLVEAILGVALTFGLFGLTHHEVTVILAAVTAAGGLLTAWTTQHGLLAAVTGFVKALMIVAVTYGAHLSDEQMAAVLSAITVLGGYYLRAQTSPVATKLTRSTVTKAA